MAVEYKYKTNIEEEITVEVEGEEEIDNKIIEAIATNKELEEIFKEYILRTVKKHEERIREMLNKFEAKLREKGYRNLEKKVKFYVVFKENMLDFIRIKYIVIDRDTEVTLEDRDLITEIIIFTSPELTYEESLKGYKIKQVVRELLRNLEEEENDP